MNMRIRAVLQQAVVLALLVSGCGQPAGSTTAPTASEKDSLPPFARTDVELKTLLADYDRAAMQKLTADCRRASETVKTIPALYAEAANLESELQLLQIKITKEKYAARCAARKELAKGADYTAVQKVFQERQRALSERLAKATSQPARGLEEVRRQLDRAFLHIDIEEIARRIRDRRTRLVVEYQSAERQLTIVVDSLHQEKTLAHRIAWLREVSMAQIIVNWAALKREGIDRSTPVSGLHDDRTVGEELAAILKSLGTAGRVQAYTVDNIILITTPVGWRRTQTLLKDSIARSDAAGQALLARMNLLDMRMDSITLSNAVNILADSCGLRLNNTALPQAGSGDVEVSCSAVCSLPLFLRLLLDDVDTTSPWTFRIVGNELILEQAKD